MTCVYCGIASRPEAPRCAGCGAHAMAAPAAAATPTTSLYEQIGRAVVDREHGNALKTLARLGEREEASERETQATRLAKVIFCLFMFWQVPWIIIPIISFGAMFFIWIYLPYKGVKAVLGWLSN